MTIYNWVWGATVASYNERTTHQKCQTKYQNKTTQTKNIKKKELTKFTIKKTKSQLSINNVFRVNYCTVHNKFSDIKPTDDNSSTSLKKKKMN